MSLNPTNPKKTPITEVEFEQKLQNKDGVFQNRIFNFAITHDLLQEAVGLAEDGNIHFNFDLDFADSEFQKIDVGSDISYNDDAPKVIFKRTVNFNRATFSDIANFSYAKFSGEANFSYAKFSNRTYFFQATFSGKADFFEATFSREANFGQATFSDGANFHAVTFSDGANFHAVTFLGEANFHAVTFSGEAKFYEARFSGEAYFSSATFSGEAEFIGATFLREAKFIGATFSEEEANFLKATFSKKANFNNATFKGEAKFYEARFSGEANFSYAEFSLKSDFFHARFSGEAKFIGATFSGKAKFIGATFLDKISFNRARFSGEAEFIGATFSDIANFYQAIFSDKVSFNGATFSDIANFYHAIFSDKVSFNGATFSPNHHTYFCNLNLKQKDDPNKRNEKETYPTPSLQFRYTIFPKLVLFSNCNLSQTTFESCTIADIKFRSCEFAKTGFGVFKRNTFENRTRQKSFWENICFALKLEGQLFKKAFSKNEDEIKKEVKELEKNNEKLHSIELETEEKRKDREDLCCQMKTALESSKRWRQAGDFYIGELEARRSKNWWEYLKLTSFKYLLGYAERISILIIWIIAIPFIAYCFIQDLSETLKITILPLALTLDLQDKDLLILVVIFFRLLSWLFWITLAVAIRRRFRF